MSSESYNSSTDLGTTPAQAGTRSLAKALREAGFSPDEATVDPEAPSEEDYDENIRPLFADSTSNLRSRKKDSERTHVLSTNDVTHIFRRDSGVYIPPDNEGDLQELLQRSSNGAMGSGITPRSQLRDLVFTKQFSAFDSHNQVSANSPFRGFYNLFWLAVALFVFRISVINWYNYGTILGSSDIMKTMFRRDVIVLLLSDGVMCGFTGVSWILQLLVYWKVLNWNRTGWIIQNLWQIVFLSGVISWTFVRDWPWTHTVFFVLHAIVMLMKQHSYAFYNGSLSTAFFKRQFLFKKLKQLESVDRSDGPSTTGPPTSAISTDHLKVRPSAAERRQSMSKIPSTAESDIDKISRAIASDGPLDDNQTQLFERIIKWEIEALTDELRGTARDASQAYPNNLTFLEHYKWIPLPTLVYELDYPKTDSISWLYVSEKMAAMIGVLFVMVQVSQYYIYPVVMTTVTMKEKNVPLMDRCLAFPWLLGDLIFPFMMEYMLVWYLIWETILNILAELTYFADRNFYDTWWNSVSWDQFARDWNRPVHIFLLRHVYHSSISSMKVNKHTATLITFFLSACVHELVMWCLFKKLRGYLLCLQMCQLPLVRLSRTKWLRGRETLGNLIFWLGIFTGPSLLCSLYLVL